MKEHEVTRESSAIENRRQGYWQEQTEAAHRLQDQGIARVVSELVPYTRREFFRRANGVLGCMDEGCEGCGFRLAGSGMLIAPEDQPAFLDKCRKMGVQKITHHDGCGAAVVSKERTKSDKPAPQLAQEFSDGVAENLGAEKGHISAVEMSRPYEFHITRFAYYDGTSDGLNLKAADGKLPNGFVLTRQLYPNAKYAIAEAQLAFEIATGHHGFGHKITEEEPFVIVVVADPKNFEMSLDNLMSELEPLSLNRKIKIYGLEAPVE